MSVETAKETLCISGQIGQKMDNIMLEEDFVVPDIKPDILNAISTNGTVCIYKKEIMDGKIKLEGSINTYVIYLADDENSMVRSMNVNLDFSKIIDFDKVKIGMILDSTIILKSIECKVLNGRKISIKAILDVDLKVSSNENLEFVKQVEQIKDVQLLNENMQVNSLLGAGNSKIYAKDTIIIDNVDDLLEIMKVDVELKNKETKISYNKILVKADACVKILYLTQDGRINSVRNTIPVMGFIDMPNVTDENLCDLKYEIKNLFVKPNNVEEHSIYVEIEIDVTCNVYELKNLDIIQDLYSPSVNLVYKQKLIKAISDKNITKDSCAIREKQIIDGLENNKIFDVQVLPAIINQTILKDKILYEGEVECKFLYSTESMSKIEIKTVNIPFNFNMDLIGIKQSSSVETMMEISNQDFTVVSDSNVDIKIDISFIVITSNNKNINVIEEINIDENRQKERYSLIIYFVRPGDSLWTIAKRFRSTIDEIVKINNIENKDRINIGEQLFIPIM